MRVDDNDDEATVDTVCWPGQLFGGLGFVVAVCCVLLHSICRLFPDSQLLRQLIVVGKGR